jgi:hypothetical protein
VAVPAPPQPPSVPPHFVRVPCRINPTVYESIGWNNEGENASGGKRNAAKSKTVSCIRSNNRMLQQQKQETYIPFTFVKKYFDVSALLSL